MSDLPAGTLAQFTYRGAVRQGLWFADVSKYYYADSDGSVCVAYDANVTDVTPLRVVPDDAIVLDLEDPRSAVTHLRGNAHDDRSCICHDIADQIEARTPKPPVLPARAAELIRELTGSALCDSRCCESAHELLRYATQLEAQAYEATS